jgi:putative addiction module component (TIGR02574 family)
MTLKDVEDGALQLSENERAELAQKLLLSLDVPSMKEIENDWLAEASYRANELDNGVVMPVSADEVRKKALSILGFGCCA